MITVPITINETNGLNRKAEPVTLGVPFARGALKQIESLSLYAKNINIPFQIKKTACWNDGSIKWSLLDFQVDIEKNSAISLILSDDTVNRNTSEHDTPTHEKTGSLINVEETEFHHIINTGNTTFYLNKTELKPFDKIIQNNQTVLDAAQSGLILKDHNNKSLKALIDTIKINHGKNYQQLTVDINGRFVSQNDKGFVLFSAELTFYASKSTVKWALTLHNPNRAHHKGNLWDLGDPGSVFFKQLSYQIVCEPSAQMDWKEDPEAEWKTHQTDDFLLYQDSSGGEHWNSKNHINKDGIVPVKFRGYQCSSHGETIHRGDRASPFIHISSNGLSLTAHIKQFWQNFPKAIQLENNTLSLSFFPEQFNDQYELQGGEKKTHTLYLDFNADKNSLDYCLSPLTPVIALPYYAQTNLLPWMPAEYTETGLEKLIHQGIEGDDNFFAKREIIDEYGWRNFGDIFADHESLYKKNNEINISHYNNQYDPVYGFVRQFVLTGDTRWLALMSDLAQHVVDIDIYDTTEDRHEYNGALFWHTSHYVDVASCSHRSYSRAHLEDDPESGGGPANEHCYAGGLAVHHFLTGSKQSKQAVITLANWMIKLHEGNGGLLERLMRFKKSELPLIKQLNNGQRIAKHKYQFNRGTGNYINCLLDAYQVSSDTAYITKVEAIIQASIHPHDNIEDRELEEIEEEAHWSYTVLLQALINYLHLKITLDEIDQHFYYARDSLMHYANWMLDNEHPYLDKPEILEYPNSTWVAQDLRKAYILLIASSFDQNRPEQFFKKSEYFMSYVIDNLKNDETRTFTRILAVLMQNHIDIKQINLFKSLDDKRYLNDATIKYKELQMYSVGGIIYQLFNDLGKSLLTLSIKKEVNWFKLRFSSVKN